MKRKKIILIAAIIALAFALLYVGYSVLKDDNGFKLAKKIEGEWLRPDGGYIFKLEDVKPDGTLKASYFNPKSINVHQAIWKLEEQKLYLFVELRDENYPGSKYTLEYIVDEDAFKGIYFQATVKQTYEVNFSRK